MATTTAPPTGGADDPSSSGEPSDPGKTRVAGEPDGAPLPYPQDRSCPYRPPADYRRLHDGGPLTRVSFYDGRPVWAVTRLATARALLTDPRLSSDRTHPQFPVPSARFSGIAKTRTPLIGVDGPEHAAERRLLIPGFTFKRINALRPEMERTVDEALDDLVAAGPPAELVSSFALPVSSRVICALLGVPYEDHDFFEEQSRRLLRGPSAEDCADAHRQLLGYLGTLVARKQHEPGRGLVDDLVHNRLGDGTLTTESLADLAWVLLVAGHETTANMIALAVCTLLEHPARLAELRADPALLPAATEELLRHLSVVDGILRLATEDIEVDGVTIRSGDAVVFAASTVNRDPGVYPHPDELDWHRPVRHHIAFGFGSHQCLGQNLARAEIEIALGRLLTRLPGLRLAQPADSLVLKPGDTVQGPVELPVTW
ncbi:cytochrome P450 [Streptomyces sp. NA04227]|uniref:cytochrome P450 n=1 Tax=Streptomyces sp. NA04227 TaxID=2742136 RepID=UPI001590D521|nr:cytochrome P450 [Streptomyces sp. NA04227]QKW10518.1 cytochrome P450 [Streptomyces sp. NA04227]